MPKKETVWKKVSFNKKTETPSCQATFRSNGQIVLNAETMQVLESPQYINLFLSQNNNLIAMQASSKDDVDAIRVSKTQPERGKDVVFFCKPAYLWLCELIGQTDVLIALTGKAEGEKVVFDLKKADVKEKRVTNRKSKEVNK